MPLHKDVEIPKNVFSSDNIVPMKIDFYKTSEKLEEIQDFLKKWAEN